MDQRPAHAQSKVKMKNYKTVTFKLFEIITIKSCFQKFDALFRAHFEGKN
jgi:hypothetical protein